MFRLFIMHIGYIIPVFNLSLSFDLNNSCHNVQLRARVPSISPHADLTQIDIRAVPYKENTLVTVVT